MLSTVLGQLRGRDFIVVIHYCISDAGSASGRWLPMASDLAVVDGSPGINTCLTIAFSLYLRGKNSSKCTGLPEARNPGGIKQC